MILKLPHQKRRTFKKHFLLSVHCEVEYQKMDSSFILEKEAVLKNKFIELGFHDSKKVVQSHFSFQEKQSVPQTLNIQQDSKPIGIAFINLDPKRELHITSDRIVFSDYHYEGFDDFQKRLENYFKLIEEELGALTLNKVGFRKINSIIIEPVHSYVDTCSIFNPSLFGLLRAGIASKESLKIMEESMVLELGSDMCMFKNQFRQLDQPDKYQAILDFDLIRNEICDTKVAIQKTLLQLNAKHFDLFMWSITDTMIQLMEET